MANKKSEILTEKEVWSIVEFARGLSSFLPGGMTPDLVNARMKDVSLNPLQATEESLNRALQNPKDSELQLQGFSENFELQSMPYKRLLEYLANMLALDLTYTPINAKEKDFKSKAYLKDLEIVENFLDKFDYKKEFLAATREMLRNETFFCAPRFDGDKYVLQELPASPTYSKITGRWDYGFLGSFSLLWFMLPGVDINLYPPFFRKKYDEVFGGSNGKQRYIPSLSPEIRGESSWVYWVDMPVDVGWIFKFDTTRATRLPFYSPLFNDLILQSLMRNLQKNINMSVASRMIIGEVPMLGDAKTSVKDMIAITPDLLGKFMALVRGAISDSIRVASAPLKNIQGISFSSENEVYDTYLRTSLASSGVNTNLIFSSSIKPNAIETQLSLNVDEQLMYILYPQFNMFLEYQINRRTKQFKWEFNFEGTQFFTNRAERFDRAMKLAEKGIVLPQKIAASIGMKPSTFLRQLEESNAMGFVDKLKPIINNFNIPKDDYLEKKEKGRPQKDQADLSEEGSETRSTGANIERGGKV